MPKRADNAPKRKTHQDIPVEQALMILESIHQKTSGQLGISQAFTLGAEALNVLAAHGDTIATLARKGLRYAD